MSVENKKTTPYLLIELLESFSSKELAGLLKIAECGYFNTDRYVIKLLNALIKKVLNKIDFNNVVKCRVYNIVFDDLPQVTFDLNKKQKALLNAKMSALTRLAERFLRIDALEQNDIYKNDLLLHGLLNKKQIRLCDKHLKKAEELSGIKNIKNLADFEFLYTIEKFKLIYLFNTGKWVKNDNINQLFRVIDLNYLVNRMNYTRTALSFRTRKPSVKYDLSITKLVNHKTLMQYLDEDYSHLILSMSSINLSLSQTTEAYTNFIGLLTKYESQILKEELRNQYDIAKNFCIGMYKKGDLSYRKHLVDIYKALDKKAMLLSGNKITAQGLKNIVNMGCKAGDFNWTLYMIEKYTPYINEKYRSEIEKFNLGFLAFEQQEYRKAIDYLLEVNNFQKSYDIDKRMLVLKAYYELEKYYTEPTAQLFRSIESFVINNKQFTDIDKKVYKNTIRIFYNLYRTKHRVGKITLEKLKTQIEEAEYIASKAWLLEKIEELS